MSRETTPSDGESTPTGGKRLREESSTSSGGEDAPARKRRGRPKITIADVFGQECVDGKWDCFPGDATVVIFQCDFCFPRGRDVRKDRNKPIEGRIVASPGKIRGKVREHLAEEAHKQKKAAAVDKRQCRIVQSFEKGAESKERGARILLNWAKFFLMNGIPP